MYDANHSYSLMAAEMRSLQARSQALKAANLAEEKLVRRANGEHSLDATILFAGGSEIAIMHGMDTYRLRLTRQNKLILTK